MDKKIIYNFTLKTFIRIVIAPITQLRTCIIKIVTFKGSQVIYHPLGTALKVKNFFLKEKFPF